METRKPQSLRWVKSSLSFSNGNCTEVAASGAGVLVRDSKLEGRSPVLAFSAAAWERFTARMKRGT